LSFRNALATETLNAATRTTDIRKSATVQNFMLLFVLIASPSSASGSGGCSGITHHGVQLCADV
jgi:hypothetical protein